MLIIVCLGDPVHVRAEHSETLNTDMFAESEGQVYR